jgi:hypothetical protein
MTAEVRRSTAVIQQVTHRLRDLPIMKKKHVLRVALRSPAFHSLHTLSPPSTPQSCPPSTTRYLRVGAWLSRPIRYSGSGNEQDVRCFSGDPHCCRGKADNRRRPGRRRSATSSRGTFSTASTIVQEMPLLEQKQSAPPPARSSRSAFAAPACDDAAVQRRSVLLISVSQRRSSPSSGKERPLHQALQNERAREAEHLLLTQEQLWPTVADGRQKPRQHK